MIFLFYHDKTFKHHGYLFTMNLLIAYMHNCFTVFRLTLNNFDQKLIDCINDIEIYKHNKM